jgi:galactose mutarotase-like enzyme
MEQIKNNHLTVKVAAQGAEIQSVVCNKTQREYFWQGDAKYWDGHSPILFPVVGGMWDRTCKYEDRLLPIEKHGFVRKRTWDLVELKEDSVTYAYTPKDELADYPFPCQISVTYRVEENHLVMHFEVKNLGEKTMYFQLGGHPAFNLPDFSEDQEVVGYIKLEGTPTSVLRAGEQGCTTPERFPFPQTEDGLVPICVETFNHEALIFDEYSVTAATLMSLDKEPIARVESDAPVFLFWQPQGVHTPFLCIEPWHGLCDMQGFDGYIHERPYMQELAAGQAWTKDMVITLY